MDFQELDGGDEGASEPLVNWRKKLKAIKNLSIIVFFFAICWSPFMIHSAIMSRDPMIYLSQPQAMTMYHMFLLLLFANCLMNPMLYAVRFHPFQVAFRIMFGLIKDEERHIAIESITSLWLFSLLIGSYVHIFGKINV